MDIGDCMLCWSVTDMRRAEIARLKIADIDSQRMVIHVVNGKSSPMQAKKRGGRGQGNRIHGPALQQNAASIAAPLLTTEALVVELPEPKAVPTGANGGGMDGMYRGLFGRTRYNLAQ